MATTARVELPPKLVPVFTGKARVRGAYGGRGSAKTRTFAKMTAIKAYAWSKSGREGIILCGRQFMNSLADSSMEEIKAAIRSEDWLSAHFDIGEKYIRTIDGRVSYSFIGLDRNIDSVKSKARILLCWIDEAEPVTEEAWQKLIPTIREEDSELWVTWNPESRKSATHKRFRLNPEPDEKVVELNWRDNPWFPGVLERERLKDKKDRPDSYPHVWEGDFVTIMEGAYFASQLTEAKAKGRIGQISADPLMQYLTFWDIGGTGLRADARSIWVAQFIGPQIRVVDYRETAGQPLDADVRWLRDSGYGRAVCVLPHDGATNDRVFDVSYESSLRQAGFEVVVIPNQGRGAAAMRIAAARRLFPNIWFNEETTKAGIEALGWYHEKRSTGDRDIGLGPEHDWSSHGADAFGLMCVAYDTPTDQRDDDHDERRGPVGGY
jgi:phage terminase large subunit